MEEQQEWILNGKPCKDLPTCLARFKEDKSSDRFIICGWGDNFIQATSGKEEHSFYCEVRWNNAIYSSPEEPSWEKLIELMSRFSDGEDFSFVEQSWTPVDFSDDSKSRRIVQIIVTIIVIAIVLFIFARSSS